MENNTEFTVSMSSGCDFVLQKNVSGNIFSLYAILSQGILALCDENAGEKIILTPDNAYDSEELNSFFDVVHHIGGSLCIREQLGHEWPSI